MVNEWIGVAVEVAMILLDLLGNEVHYFHRKKVRVRLKRQTHTSEKPPERNYSVDMSNLEWDNSGNSSVLRNGSSIDVSYETRRL